MITIQLLTRNNETTIQQCLESILPLKPQILVGDMGSSDNTVKLCQKYATVFYMDEDRAYARNALMKHAKHQWQMAMEPWEALAQGHIQRLIGDCSYATIINHHTLSKEIRLWKNGKFVNPVYERLNANTDLDSDIVFYSIGQRDYGWELSNIKQWMLREPTLSSPFYYQACIHFALQEYEKFYPIADHFLFLETKPTMSHVMLRYYYAMAHLIHRRQVKPTLQNINLCLCARPLMAEFWCLMADVYYHLLKKFELAAEFYENAIILGSRRLKSDKWPMDISKYGTYPKMMIESCEKILKNTAIFKPT